MPAKTPADFITVACKAAFVAFAVAVVLNAFGLTGDPSAWFARTFPFMVRH